MTITDATDLPKEHLDFALPRHLGELINSGYQQRGQSSVDLLINNHNWQAFISCLSFAKKTLTEFVTTVGESSSRSMRVGMCIEVFASFNGTTTPRAGRELVGGSNTATNILVTTSLLNGFNRIISAVWCCLTPYPQTHSEGCLTPA